jgi:tRNA(Ile)-lysidine synthase
MPKVPLRGQQDPSSDLLRRPPSPARGEGTLVPIEVETVFDRRLDPSLEQPICVAFSGGGDSLFALIATADWAARCGRSVIALHVDHQLQAGSGGWRDFAAGAAARLGAGFRALAWRGEKPASGLASAARRARHALIAEAARAAGATCVVFGHTADDIAESALMRTRGSSLGTPSEWRPSPVWPEGRGVFALRPLLAVRRAAIREALRAGGWAWIDDPANEDPRQPRARARRDLAGAAPILEAPVDQTAAAVIGEADAWGAIRLDRQALRRAPEAVGRRVLAAAMLCAGGGERPPRRERLAALFDRLAGPDEFTATLAGARLVAGGEVRIARNAGEAARGGLAPIALEPGRTTVWDGRFEIVATRPGCMVRALGGSMSSLDAEDRRRLKAVPAEARAGLPLVTGADGVPACAILAKLQGVEARSLVAQRFSAAYGAILKEPRA